MSVAGDALATARPPIAPATSDSPTEPVASAARTVPERVDGYLLLAIGLVGTTVFAPTIDWIAYAVLFWTIDVIGYWPGVAVARLTRRKRVPTVFTHLYNLTHSSAGGLALALGYAVFAPASAASALAIAVHLGIDRGLLGNRLKRPDEVF